MSAAGREFVRAVRAELGRDVDLAPAANDCQPPSDEGDTRRQREEHEKVNGAAPPPPAPQLNPWDTLVHPVTEEWFDLRPPPRRFLFRDMRTGDGSLPQGKVGQLIAEGGVGKTMILIMLAFAVTTGSPWLGCFSVNDTPGRVLLLLGEEDLEEAKRRIHEIASVMPSRPPARAIVVLPLAGVVCSMVQRDPKTGELGDTSFLNWVRDRIGPDLRLVVVDPLSRFAGADAEKDNAAATRFLQALESLAARGASIIFAHHTNQLSRGDGKVTSTSSRGVTALVDGARWQVSLKAESFKATNGTIEETITLENPKSNYSKKFQPVVLLRGPYGTLIVATPEQIAQIAAARNAPTTEAALKKEDIRKQTRATRAQDEAARRAESATSKEAAKRQRDADDDEAARQVIAERRPDAAVRDLVAEVKRVRACGYDRAMDAILRVRQRMSVPAVPGVPTVPVPDELGTGCPPSLASPPGQGGMGGFLESPPPSPPSHPGERQGVRTERTDTSHTDGLALREAGQRGEDPRAWATERGWDDVRIRAGMRFVITTQSPPADEDPPPHPTASGPPPSAEAESDADVLMCMTRGEMEARVAEWPEQRRRRATEVLRLRESAIIRDAKRLRGERSRGTDVDAWAAAMGWSDTRVRAAKQRMD
jgi:RecA-family ATPase